MSHRLNAGFSASVCGAARDQSRDVRQDQSRPEKVSGSDFLTLSERSQGAWWFCGPQIGERRWSIFPSRAALSASTESRIASAFEVFAASKRCQSNKITLTAIIREKQTATNYFRIWKRSLLPRT